jgi:hypothetical protein
MLRWADFEADAPALAAEGAKLIDSFHFVLVGTIRRDGTPRISAVETHIVDGNLMQPVIPGTLKARDLQRDPRILLNSPITHPGDLNTEFKLRGRAVEVDDQALREATAEQIETVSGWRPPPTWHFFTIDIEDAAYISWDGGWMETTRWTPDGGLKRTREPVAVVD